jgi:hypothetical protein
MNLQMYDYLKNCLFMKQQRKLWEKKEVNKGRKTIFMYAEIEKERQNKKPLFF